VRPEWLKDMPSSWCSVPFGSIFTQSKRKNTRLQRDFVLSVMKDRGVIPYTEKGNVGNKVSDDLSGYKFVDKGDFVLNSMNLYMGSVGVSKYDGVTSTAYIVCKPSEEVHAGYYNYLIQFKGFQEYVGLLGKGIMEIREAVRWTALKSVFVPLPDLATQRQIADFLDRETARIDLLIEKKQRLVALLGEKRSAIITEVVTGGGDRRSVAVGGQVSDLEQKRRAVRQRLIEENEFPHIPEDWGVERLRFLFSESKERNGKLPVGEMLSVSEYRGVVPREYEHEEQKRTEEELENYRVVRPGQLAVNSMWLNHLGLGVSEHTGHVSPAYNVYDISKRLDRRFVHHLMRSNYYLKIYLRYLYGIRPNSFQIKSNDWASIPIIVPDLATQRQIADFLDRETARIDTIKERTNASIDRLKEYRSALITVAVTGQIDVTTYAKSGTTDRRLDAIQEEMDA
jgi:type I restriction enzyme, S subunit